MMSTRYLPRAICSAFPTGPAPPAPSACRLAVERTAVRRIAAVMIAVVKTMFVSLIVLVSTAYETASRDGRTLRLSLEFLRTFLSFLKRILNGYNRPVSAKNARQVAD